MKTPDEFAKLMSDESPGGAYGDVTSFDFVRPLGALVVLPCVSAFLLFLAYLELDAGEQSGGVVFLVVFAAIFPFMIINGCLSTSDMFVDDKGISRVLFGKVWCRLAWSNIEKITSSDGVQPRSRRPFRSIVIYPKVKSRFRIWPSGKMVLPQTIVGQERLIEVLNRYVLAHHIVVQRISAGIKTDISQL